MAGLLRSFVLWFIPCGRIRGQRGRCGCVFGRLRNAFKLAFPSPENMTTGCCGRDIPSCQWRSAISCAEPACYASPRAGFGQSDTGPNRRAADGRAGRSLVVTHGRELSRWRKHEPPPACRAHHNWRRADRAILSFNAGVMSGVAAGWWSVFLRNSSGGDQAAHSL